MDGYWPVSGKQDMASHRAQEILRKSTLSRGSALMKREPL